jgi:hypothetical protein
MKGLRAGLVPKASQIIAEPSYELADPTIDSQIVKLKAADSPARHRWLDRFC